jgi:hypothetical protein
MKSSLLTFIAVFATVITFAQSSSSTATSNQEETRLIQLQTENPADLKANYNLAAYYYNLSVELLQGQASGTLAGVEGIVSELAKNFNLALPPALAAYKIDNQNLEVLKMLSGIYFGINDMDSKSKIDKEIKKLSK